jgi:lipid-A-disaccharide synthase-like uncharacterized protein
MKLNTEFIWVIIGLLGQALFFLRFFFQWLESEKKKDSVIPHVFWYFSIGGGIVLLAYAVYRKDPVFILGQGMGLIVYFRNLVLIDRKNRRAQ